MFCAPNLMCESLRRSDARESDGKGGQTTTVTPSGFEGS
jgi:hypothetical protein